MKSCFFIGHRDAPMQAAPLLGELIERHITQLHVREFVVGCYGAFDSMVSHQLGAAKERHGDISNLLLSPYHPSEREIILPKGFDAAFYPPGMEKVPKRFAIVRANRYMIENSDYLIAYVWHPASNARELYEYALRLEKHGKIHTYNLADYIRGNVM